MGSRSGARNAVLFTCALLALLIASAGVAVVPDIAQLAAPIVCAGGSLETQTRSYTRGPGTSGSRTSASCVDAAGTRTPLNAGLVALVLMVELFVPFAAIGWFAFRRKWSPGGAKRRRAEED